MTEKTIPSKGYLNEDFRIFHNSDRNGTDVGVHFHSFYKVTLVCRGEGTYMVDGRVYDIRPKDVILVGMHVPHQPVFPKGILYDRYVIYISPQLLQAYGDERTDLTDIFRSEAASVLRLKERASGVLFALAESAENESCSDEYGSSLAARLSVLRLMIEIRRCMKSSQAAAPTLSPGHDKMLSVLSYINENLSEALTIDTLSERFYISRYHMMRLFKETYGYSIHEYITERRLLMADDMLRTGIEPAKVCYECGFGSYSAFARAYRRRYHISPGRAALMPPVTDIFLSPRKE